MSAPTIDAAEIIRRARKLLRDEADDVDGRVVATQTEIEQARALVLLSALIENAKP